MVYASRDGCFFAMEPCRRTLGDTDTFVIPQFWEARDHSVWWDLRYLHVWLMGSFSDSQLKLHRWLKDKFTKLVARTGFPLRAPPEGVGQCVAVCRHICPCGIFLEQRKRPAGTALFQQGHRHEGCMRRASQGHDFQGNGRTRARARLYDAPRHHVQRISWWNYVWSSCSLCGACYEGGRVGTRLGADA